MKILVEIEVPNGEYCNGPNGEVCERFLDEDPYTTCGLYLKPTKGTEGFFRKPPECCNSVSVADAQELLASAKVLLQNQR